MNAVTTKRRELRQGFQQLLDAYGVMCTIEQEQPLEDALADFVSVHTATRPKTRKTSADQSELYQLARALADVCVIDFDANRSRLFGEARRLAKATPTPTAGMVARLYGQGGAWYEEDWRGQRGYTPQPAQVRESWARLASERDRVKEYTV
jgi:hypothetical protein